MDDNDGLQDRADGEFGWYSFKKKKNRHAIDKIGATTLEGRRKDIVEMVSASPPPC